MQFYHLIDWNYSEFLKTDAHYLKPKENSCLTPTSKMPDLVRTKLY